MNLKNEKFNEIELTDELISNSYGFIYVTRNKINGKIYIGKRKFYCRWKTYLGSGIKISLSIKKYGKENFERFIIKLCSEDEIDNDEIFFIKKYDSMNPDIGYNLCAGGKGIISRNVSLDERRVMSKRIRENWKNDDFRNNQIKVQTERWTPELRNEKSELLKKVWTPELREKQSLIKKEQYSSPEMKEKLSKCRKLYFSIKENKSYLIGENNKKTKHITCFSQNGEIIFDGKLGKTKITEMGFNSCSVYQCIAGKQKTHRNCTFIEKKDEV